MCSDAAPPAKKSMFKRIWEWVVNFASTTIQSIKQWWGVLPERVAQRTREESWSRSHGFFIQMGGFVLYERGVPTQVLDYPRFKRLLKLKAVDVPLITASDIQDRSKGDAISKGFVVLQTTWFVIQCIARVIKDLPLCELEIVTLGFAVLNAIIYAVFWNKPQGVGVCISIPLKDANAVATIIQDLIGIVELGTNEYLQQHQQERSGANHQHPQTFQSTRLQYTGAQSLLQNSFPGELTLRGDESGQQYEHRDSEPDYRPRPISQFTGSRHPRHATNSLERTRKLESTKQEILELVEPFLPQNTVAQNPEGVSGWLSTQLHKDYQGLPIWRFVPFVFFRCTQFILRPLAKMADSDTVAAGALRVPFFYAYSGSDWQNGAQTEPHASPSTNVFMQAIAQTRIQAASQVQSQAYLASCVIGVIFGMIHLLAWSATFATAIESILWRISAVVITVVPAIVVIGWQPFRYLGIFYRQELVMKRLPDVIIKVAKFIQVAIPAALGVPFYVLARCTLLTLALISLRDLPPGVHTDVSWTSFIPHF